MTVIAVVKRYGDQNCMDWIQNLLCAGCIVVKVGCSNRDFTTDEKCGFRSVDDYFVQVIVQYLTVSTSNENVELLSVDRYAGHVGPISIVSPRGIFIWLELWSDVLQNRPQYFRMNADVVNSDMQAFNFNLVNPYGTSPSVPRQIRCINQEDIFRRMQNLNNCRRAYEREAYEFVLWQLRKNRPSSCSG